MFSKAIPRWSAVTVMRETEEIVLLTRDKRWFPRRVKWTIDMYEVTDRKIKRTKTIKV